MEWQGNIIISSGKQYQDHDVTATLMSKYNQNLTLLQRRVPAGVMSIFSETWESKVNYKRYFKTLQSEDVKVFLPDNLFNVSLFLNVPRGGEGSMKG